jgi:hypothetical protein
MGSELFAVDARPVATPVSGGDKLMLFLLALVIVVIAEAMAMSESQRGRQDRAALAALGPPPRQRASAGEPVPPALLLSVALPDEARRLKSD